MNLYSYVNNAPQNLTDPLGFWGDFGPWAIGPGAEGGWGPGNGGYGAGTGPLGPSGTYTINLQPSKYWGEAPALNSITMPLAASTAGLTEAEIATIAAGLEAAVPGLLIAAGILIIAAGVIILMNSKPGEDLINDPGTIPARDKPVINKGDQYERPGKNLNDALDDFLNEEPTGVSGIRTDKLGDFLIGELPDGGSISLRPSGSNGVTTIQINRGDGTKITIRYPDASGGLEF